MLTEPQRQRLLRALAEPDAEQVPGAGPGPDPGPGDDELEDIVPVPLDAALEDRLVAAILASPASSSPAAGASTAAPGVPGQVPGRQLAEPAAHRAEPDAAAAASGVKEAPVLDLAARRRRTVGRVTGALALAAAFVFVLRGGLDGTPDEPLAPYRLDVRGGARFLGAEEPAPARELRVRLGEPLRIDLQPDEAVRDAEIHCYLRQGERLVRWDVKPERSDVGRFSLKGSIGELPGLGSGTWELVFVVGREGHLPEQAEVAQALRGAAAAPSPPRSWQLHTKRLLIEER